MFAEFIASKSLQGQSHRSPQTERVFLHLTSITTLQIHSNWRFNTHKTHTDMYMYCIYVVNTTHKLNMTEKDITEKDFARLLVMVSWEVPQQLEVKIQKWNAHFKKSSISMDLALWPAIPHFSRTPETCAFMSNSFGISYNKQHTHTQHHSEQVLTKIPS